MKHLKTALALCLTVLVFAAVMHLDTLAATWNNETVYYTVVNDTMLDLSYSSMPASVNGVIYVPYSLFVSYFDIKSVYSADDRVLFLSNASKMVKFDMNRGIAYDRNQNEIRQSAAVVRGQVFVPAEFTANYFGLTYYLHPDANIVRIGDSGATYPDVFLAGMFSSQMDAMLSALHAGTTTTTTTTTTTEATSASDPAMPTEPAPATEPTRPTVMTTTTLPPSAVELCFTADEIHAVQDVLNWLDKYDLQACFFTDGRDADVAAAIVAAGHTLGICLPDGTADADLGGTADTINDRLYRSIRLKTRLLLSEAPQRTLAEAGYAPAPSHIYFNRGGTLGLTSLLNRGESDVLLLLDCGSDTLSLLDALQAAMHRSGAHFEDYRTVFGD